MLIEAAVATHFLVLSASARRKLRGVVNEIPAEFSRRPNRLKNFFSVA
jgi:hypothetical protein